MIDPTSNTTHLDPDLRDLLCKIAVQEQVRRGLTCDAGTVRYDYSTQTIKVDEQGVREFSLKLCELKNPNDVLNLLYCLLLSRKAIDPELAKIVFQVLDSVVAYHFDVDIFSCDQIDWKLTWKEETPEYPR